MRIPATSLTIGPKPPPRLSRPNSVRTTAPSSASSWAERSESWLPVTNTNGLPMWATRATSADSSGEPRSERSPGNSTGPLRAARGRRDQASEPDELRVELLVERAARAADGRDSVERARDVGAVGVVLRRVHLPARREQGDERRTDDE